MKLKVKMQILILLATAVTLFAACQTAVDERPSLSAQLFGTKVPDVPLVGPPAAAVDSIRLELAASGLKKPVYAVDVGNGRWLAAEQSGLVQIIVEGQVLPEPLLDISAQLATDGSERGLLGLAAHPDFAQNGYFYVVYTNLDGNTEISRFTVSAENPDQADLDSQKLILFVEQPYGNHNGGQILFGPDGYLYIGLGDGGAVSDPFDNAQDKGTVLGALLRLDVDSGDPYTVPDDNPFVAERNALGEVWAIGLRNPFAFRFDRETGDLYISDVGQEGPEEINFQPADSPAGVNYGWPYREGSGCYEAETCRSQGLRPPIFEYEHGVDGCAIIGGQVYRGQQFPELAGNYFFSDFCTGIIWTLRYDANVDEWVRTAVYDTETQVSAIVEDERGELYVLTYRDGELWQIRP